MNSSRSAHTMPKQRNTAGFTLIEVMITVAIIGILTAIALPVYKNYIIRGKLVAGTNSLAIMRAQMEQYYQDNRTYASIASTTPAIVPPCVATPVIASANNLFNVGCSGTPTNTGYLLLATGTGLLTGASYTVDQNGAMQTTGFPTAWGAVPAGNACWIMRKGDSC